MFQDAGVVPGETVEAGSHNAAGLAVYNGEVDFATTFYSPPSKPEGEPAWQPGDDPDVPADLVPLCGPNAEGTRLFCGDWRVLDARASIRAEAPDIVQKARILMISPEIPNDTLSFGPEFPDDLRAQIEEALVAFSQTEAWGTSIGSQDFYGWTGLSVATDEEYDFIREMVEMAGITMENIGQ
jgi:phosphonate transport system substrate-binding protein